MRAGLRKLVEKCVTELGEDAVTRALATLESGRGQAAEKDVLTIIANAGVHRVPDSCLRGEVLIASEGNWAVGSEEAMDREIRRILAKVAQKLKQRAWRKVFLVPTGHPVVSMNIKLLVYRALRLNTADWMYLNGIYHNIEIDQRIVAIEAEPWVT